MQRGSWYSEPPVDPALLTDELVRETAGRLLVEDSGLLHFHPSQPR